MTNVVAWPKIEHPTELTSEAFDVLERLPAHELVGWAVETFGDRFLVVTALQLEGVVIADLARRFNPDVRVLTIDTGRLPQETYDYIEHISAVLGVHIEVISPDASEVHDFVAKNGPNGFYRARALRRACCNVRKVAPLGRALDGYEAWATGLRREQSATRADVPKVDVDGEHGGILKLSPLAGWTRDMVTDYTERNRLPAHPLYAKGYTSIGCAPCSRPILPGEGDRAGRWWWETGSDKECGLHDVARRKNIEVLWS